MEPVFRTLRRLRFMIKSEMQRVKIVNFLIRHSKTIPVDRRAGAGAYAVAVERSCEGEIRAYRVPRRLGGGAPTLDEALARDEAEIADRARKQRNQSGNH